MDRSQNQSYRRSRWVAAALCLFALAPAVGCIHQILATGVYLIDGGNMVDGECSALENERVVVFCRPPLSSEYSHAGASRSIAKQVSLLIRQNVPGAKVVDPREVDEWLDENDSNDFESLGHAVGATRVLQIELDHFDLFNGKTLYQGNADVTLAVYDMTSGDAEMVWDKELGEVRFPGKSGIPAQDKPVREFQTQFVSILSANIARHFHKHDPHANFAIDAIANR